MTIRRTAPYLLLAVASLILAPVFVRGLPCSDDTLPHLYRAVQFDLNLRAGAPGLPWGPDLLRGYGYPIFGFYAPLALWLIEAIHLLGADFALAFRLAFPGALLLAACGAYALARRYFSVRAAFVAGLAYLFSPYLLFDGIRRGALPETLALGLLPWTLAAIERAARRPCIGRMALAVFALAALLLTHNVVPVFGIGLALALAALSRHETADSQENEREASVPSQPRAARFGFHLQPVFIILFAALGLTSFFWLPALAELNYTQSRRADPPAPPLRDWPRFDSHLVPPYALVEWPGDPADPDLLNPPLGRGLGPGQVAVAAIGLAVLALRPHPRRAEMAIIAAATFASTYLASTLSEAWWHRIAALNFIQLPTRFLGPASLGAAMLCGLAVDAVTGTSAGPARTGRGSKLRFVLAPFASFGVAVSAAAVALSGWPWLYPAYCPVPESPSRQDLVRSTVWSRWLAESAGEVLPRWVDAMPPEDALISQYDSGGRVNRLASPEGVQTLDWQSSPGRDRYVLSSEVEASLLYRSFYFPGWTARLDGEPIPIRITSPEGLMALELPAGQHTLEIAFGLTPIRVASLAFSGGFAVALAALAVRYSKVHARPAEVEAEIQGRREAAERLRAQGTRGLAVVSLGLLALKFGVVDRLNSPVRAERLRDGELAGVGHPARVAFSGEVAYLGYSAPDRVASGSPFRITQYWIALRPLGVPYGFSMRVADDTGRVWGEPARRPFGYTDYPGTESWPMDRYARDAFEIALRAGTPPGEYWLEVSAFRRDIALALTPQGAPTGPDPSQARVGKIVIAGPDRGVDARSAGMGVFSPVEVRDGLTLLGWSLPNRGLASGEPAHVELLWTADRRLVETSPLSLSLTDEAGNRIGVFDLAPGGANYPLAEWPPGAVVRDQWRARVSPRWPSGAYEIRLESPGRAPIALGILEVAAPSRTFDLPAIETPTDVPFGEWARLAGFTFGAASASPGDVWRVDLAWQATGETATDYRVFVHLRDASDGSGVPLAQSDSVPAEWTRPTTGWLAGEFILDRHGLSLPPDLPPGDYAVVAGLYDPATGARLAEAQIGRLAIR